MPRRYPPNVVAIHRDTGEKFILLYDDTEESADVAREVIMRWERFGILEDFEAARMVERVGA